MGLGLESAGKSHLLYAFPPICAPWLRGSQTFGAPSIGPSFGQSGGGHEEQKICRGFTHNNILAVQSWLIDTLQSNNRFVQYIQVHCEHLAPPADRALFNFWPESAAAKERVTSGPYRTSCPAREAPVGIHGRAGLFVDAIGLICGPLPPGLGAPVTKLPGPLTQAPSAVTPMKPITKNMMVPDDMFVITRPSNGDRVQQGQLTITATAPKVGGTDVTELELRYLDAPPNQRDSYPYVTVFSVNTKQLLLGYPLAQIVTGGYGGRWQVRARAAMKAAPGSWSLPVQFQLVVTQPTQSLSSSQLKTSPLAPSSIKQPPPPGGAATQMLRTPSAPSQGIVGGNAVIRPRGIEPKPRLAENQTKDQAPEAEKKP